tara:strand:+ start:1364 stop:2479 length:1116 start_codon:yes stop_codon:yes gene_type:complete
MKIEIYKSFNAELELEWVSLEEHSLSATPFQSYTWVYHWFKEVGLTVYGIDPSIVRVSIENTTHLILPFGIRSYKGFKVLEWMGGIQSDYMIPLSLEGSSILTKNFDKTWFLINKKLPPYDLMYLTKQIDFLGEIQNPFVTYFPNFHLTNSYQAILESNWDEFIEKNIKKKVINDSRRQLRRISELGNLRFVVAENKSEIVEIINTMISQKSRRYRETGNWDMFEIKEYRNLYKKLNQDLGYLGKVHVSALYLDEKIISTHWGFISSDYFYYLMPTHDGESYKKFSPGRLLLENLIKWSTEKRIRVFDFTVGNEDYKKVWTNSVITLSESVNPVTFKGVIFSLFLKLKYKINKMTLVGNVAKKIYNLLRKS